MEEVVLGQPKGSEWDAPALGRSPASVTRAGCLLLAFGVLGWDQARGFGPGADVLSKVLIVLLVLVACRKRGGALTWLTFFSGLLLFLELRSAVHSLSGIQPHTTDLQNLERTLFFGVLPSQFLQEVFFDPGNLGPLDCFATAVNWSYFVVPYAVVLLSWVVQPRATHRLVYPLALTLLVSVLICAVLPAAPPWLASAEPGAFQVHAIMHSAGAQFDAAIHLQMYQSVGDPNPTACLPSVHFAVTFVLFLYAISKRRIWAIVGGAYAAAMLVSLVYLGEHYVVDTILGGAIAAGAWYTCSGVARSRAVGMLRVRFTSSPLWDDEMPRVDVVEKG